MRTALRVQLIPLISKILVFLLIGYAGFLRVVELYSLKVGDISILDDNMAISVRKRKNDQYREGHTVYIAKSGTVTCPVTTTRRPLAYLTGSSPETPLIRTIVKSKKSMCFHPTKGISTATTIREEFIISPTYRHLPLTFNN